MLLRPTSIATAGTVISLLFSIYLLKHVLDEWKLYLKLSQESAAVDNALLLCPVLKTWNPQNKACAPGFVRDGHLCKPCPKETFSLRQWTACKTFIDCNEIRSSVRPKQVLYSVGNWYFHLAEWRGYEVLYAKAASSEILLTTEAFEDLPPHLNTLQPVGYCAETGVALFAKDEPILGPLRDVRNSLKSGPCDTWVMWFRLCIEYVQLLVHLHTSSLQGSYVLCNSHSLEQIADQLVVSRDLHLMLGGYDNLQKVTNYENGNGHLVKCSEHELVGPFVAPEQRWPFARFKVYNFKEQPSYDEKTDIWKVPDLVSFMLEWCGSDMCKEIQDYLTVVHLWCKRPEPADRPNATELYYEYVSVWEMVGGPQITKGN